MAYKNISSDDETKKKVVELKRLYDLTIQEMTRKMVNDFIKNNKEDIHKKIEAHYKDILQ